MSKRFWPAARPAPVLGLVLVGLLGCQSTWHEPNVRPRHAPTVETAAARGAEEVPPVLGGDRAGADDFTGTRQLVRGFFKSDRPRGGWSDQANEIEGNLGIR